MKLTPIEELKFNLQETKGCAYFTDAELGILLAQNKGNVKKASYVGCMIKAESNAIKLGPIDIESNEAYWLRQARRFQDSYTGGIKRADEK